MTKFIKTILLGLLIVTAPYNSCLFAQEKTTISTNKSDTPARTEGPALCTYLAATLVILAVAEAGVILAGSSSIPDATNDGFELVSTIPKQEHINAPAVIYNDSPKNDGPHQAHHSSRHHGASNYTYSMSNDPDDTMIGEVYTDGTITLSHPENFADVHASEAFGDSDDQDHINESNFRDGIIKLNAGSIFVVVNDEDDLCDDCCVDLFSFPAGRSENSNLVTSVDFNDFDLSETVYPNPFSSEFNIRFASAGLSSAELQIYEMGGKLVDRKSYYIESDSDTYEVKYDGSDLHKGMYIYQLRLGDTVKSGIIAKE